MSFNADYLKAVFGLIIMMAAIVTGGFAAPLGMASETLYQSALQAVRNGNLNQAESILKDLVGDHPENLHYRNDYIQVLSLAGKNEAALEWMRALDRSRTPAYVLEAAARSARNLRQYDLSRSYYAAAALNAPDRLTPKIGLALLEVDQGNAASAIATLLALEDSNPTDLDLLYALAYAFETAKVGVDQLRIYQKILQLKPGDPDISRREILLINELGANSIAIEKAKKRKDLLAPEQWARLKWDQAAYQIRWGEITAESESARFEETDGAIRLLKKNLRLGNELPVDPQIWVKRARFDLIVALRDRNEMPKVIDHARILEKERAEIPSYVLAAIGDAHLYLENPQVAIGYYQKALQKDPKMFEVELALFYAYIESEEHEKARELIDRIDLDQADVRRRWIDKGKRSLTKGNPRKTTTEITAALARAFGNELEEAQQRIERLSERAPFNAQLVREKAEIYASRGWPRKARAEYESGLHIDSNNLGLRLGRARNQSELRRYPEAEQSLDEINALYGDEKAVQRQYRLWQIHNLRELRLEVRGGVNSGSVVGSDTLTFDQHLYSSPIDYHYRVFLHTLWNKTTFPEGIGRFGHYGLGLEYRIPDLLLSAEVHDNDFTRHRVGGTLFASLDLNDYLNLSGGLQSFSDLAPYRAMKNGIFAQSADLGFAYRLSESRRFDGGAAFLNFSDGNKRVNLQGSYLERWITAPSYVLNSILSVFYSHNSKQGVPYFNPSNGASVELTLDNDWLTYRHYDQSFHQRFALGIGGYWQDHFGAGPIGSFLYEHRWSANNTLDLVYGASVASRIYDGNRQTNLAYYLTLNWRF